MSAPPVAPPANDPGVLSRLLNAVRNVYSNPNDAGLLGMASGFGAAGAPHAMTPISMGQAVNMANQSAQAYRQQVVGANIQQEAALPYQVMRTQALEKSFRDAMNTSLPAHQRAAAAYRVDSLMGWNAASDPTVANRLAQIKAGYQPVPQAPGTTLTTAAKVAAGGGQTAHGAVPEGSTYNPATNTVQQAAGAPAVLAANAANKAGGAAAATYPYGAALHSVTAAPSQTVTRFGPTPGPFAPVQPPPPAPAVPNPAAMQRMIGLQQGLTNAAQTAGRPPPMVPNPAPIPPAPPVGMAPQAAPAPPPVPVAPRPAPAPQAAPLIPGAGPPIGPAPQNMRSSAFSAGPNLVGYEMTKAQVAQASQTNAAYQKEAGDAVDTLAQVKELQAASQDFAPGQFAELRIKGLQWLQTAGLISPAQMRELGSAQEGTKMSIQLQSTLVRSLGSREAAQVFATLGRGVPNLTLSPDGFAKMTAYMSGMARYKSARASRAQAYYNAQNFNGVNATKDQFIANSNPAYFIIASAPPATQREMIAQMGPAKGEAFLRKWAKAAAAGWAPMPGAYQGQP